MKNEKWPPSVPLPSGPPLITTHSRRSEAHESSHQNIFQSRWAATTNCPQSPCSPSRVSQHRFWARVKSRIKSEHNLCTTRTNSPTYQLTLHSCRGKFGRDGTQLKVNSPHLRHLHKPQPDIHFLVASNCVENQLKPEWTVMTMHMTVSVCRRSNADQSDSLKPPRSPSQNQGT